MGTVGRRSLLAGDSWVDMRIVVGYGSHRDQRRLGRDSLHHCAWAVYEDYTTALWAIASGGARLGHWAPLALCGSLLLASSSVAEAEREPLVAILRIPPAARGLPSVS